MTSFPDPKFSTEVNRISPGRLGFSGDPSDLPGDLPITSVYAVPSGFFFFFLFFFVSSFSTFSFLNLYHLTQKNTTRINIIVPTTEQTTAIIIFSVSPLSGVGGMSCFGI